jgi:hypothetical protein
MNDDAVQLKDQIACIAASALLRFTIAHATNKKPAITGGFFVAANEA